MYCIEMDPRIGRPEICDCSAQLQRTRRHVREDFAKKEVEEAERARARPQVRPDYSDPVTKLGA